MTESRSTRPLDWSATAGRTVAFAGGLMCLVGVVVRCTVADTSPSLAPLYYATPAPVLVALAGMAAVACRQRRRRLAVAWLLLAGGLATWSVPHLLANRDSPPGSDSISVMCWNAARGVAGWDRVAGEVRSRSPDVVGLVEAGGTGPVRHRFWQEQCPGYSVSTLGSGMVLLVKGRVEQAGSGSLRGTGRFRRFDVSVRGHEFTLVLVDIEGSLRNPRQFPLKQLAARLEPLDDRPVILMGDFNTPSDSAWFEPIRERFDNAFDEAGDGYRPTWPVPIPVLDLDQAWGNRHIRWDTCLSGWTVTSDHRPLLLRFGIKRGVAGSP